MTNPLTHDPFYRRVKDVLIVLFALYTLFPSIKDKLFKADEDKKQSTSVEVLQVSVQNMDIRLSRLEDKIDRLIFYQRRNRE